MIKRLTFVKDGKEKNIEYLKSSYKKMIFAVYFIDVLMIIIFDWQVWVPVLFLSWILISYVSIRNDIKLADLPLNIRLLLYENWLPKDKYTRKALSKDFGISKKNQLLIEEINRWKK